MENCLNIETAGQTPSNTSGSDLDSYVKNSQALWASAPRLALAVDGVDEMDFLACQPVRSGPGLTCQVVGDNGQPVYVNSRYDPQAEAEKWVEGVLEQTRKQEQANKNQIPICYFVDGFGLGSHIQALFERIADEAFIVVSEPSLALLRTALEYQDFSEYLAKKRLVILTQADRQEIFTKLQDYSKELLMGVVFTHPFYRANQTFHQQIHSLVSEYVSYLRAHTISLLANGIITCENVLKNLPTYVATPSIGVLQNRFSGYPAVVVSAGPSLRRNLPILKKYRDRMVVIAVQTTLKPLLDFGITPDFVTSLDYHPVSKRFFEGLGSEQLRRVHLVAEPKANWEVIDYYRNCGVISLLGNDFADTVLGGDKSHEGLASGATVAHLAFYLAEYIGAAPILFIGQDLGFTDNVYYSPGTALHSVWQPELNRFMTLEMKEWQRIVRHRNILRKVPDIHGDMIYTDEQMFTYLQQFEKDFAKCSVRVIDASGGGTRKQYCEAMDFTTAAETLCVHPIPKERFAYMDELNTFDRSRLIFGQEQLTKRIEEVEAFEAISRETVALVTEMLGLLDDQQALNRKMIRLDELRTMVKHRVATYKLVMYVSQGAEMYRFREDRKIGKDSVTGKERQRRQLQRDSAYVSELVEGCQRLLEMLRNCQKRFDTTVLHAAGEATLTKGED